MLLREAKHQDEVANPPRKSEGHINPPEGPGGPKIAVKQNGLLMFSPNPCGLA
jgi:hypothetical protein